MYKNQSGDIILVSGKHVVCYNVATKDLLPVKGTANIGNVHRWWPLGKFSIAEICKNKKFFLVKMIDTKVIKQFDLPTSGANRLFIDFDGHKMVCVLNKDTNTLTLFDDDLNVIENISLKLYPKEDIKNIFFEDHGKIILILYNKQSSVCRALKYYDFFVQA